MSNLKTTKEIQLAALTFRKAFRQGKADTLEGTFIPSSPSILYQQHQYYLIGSIFFGLLFLYLFYNIWYVDAVYYWHVDVPVIIGLIIVFAFLIASIYCLYSYLTLSNSIKLFLEQPNQNIYGAIITEEYYFENTPTVYHIIPRANIIRIDYEELQPNNEIYLEILLDMEDHIEVRGLFYLASKFDIKAWIGPNKQSA